MYGEYYESPSANPPAVDGKVDVVCELMRESLEKNRELKKNFFTVYLSTFIKASNREMEGALKAVEKVIGEFVVPIFLPTMYH